MENRKEDLARMIARNMASSESVDEIPAPAMGVTDFGEDAYDDNYFAPSGGVQTARKRPSGSSSARSGSSGQRKSSSSGSKSAGKKKMSAKKKKKKRKVTATKVLLICTCIAVTGLATTIGLFIAGQKSYENSFHANTYIGGVDVGGMDKEQAVAELKKKSVIPETVYITKKDGTGINIRLSDIGYEDNTEELIEQIYNKQEPDQWFSAKFDKEEYTITDGFYYDKKKLEELLSHKLLTNQKTTVPKDAYITQNANGSFSVVPEEDGDSIDESKINLLYEYVENELDNMNFDIAIGSVDCYLTAKLRAEELYEDCAKLNNLHNIQISFDFIVDTEMITSEQVMDWVTFDENAPVDLLQVDRDAVERYVEGLSEKYDTFGKDREFESTSRGTIIVPQGQGCYGWWLDIDKMTNLIVGAIEDCESLDADPIYYENPDSKYSYTCNPDWYTPTKDYGDTYFDVDLKEQHLWYYENGKLKLESDLVSGYPSESRNTPGGVYKLWIKERGKTLVGSSDGHSYASYVEYWNNISTISIGFHDASWQNGVFGGEKYKSSTWGSHGCINLPFDAAKYIYENVDYGTPVFAYW